MHQQRANVVPIMLAFSGLAAYIACGQTGRQAEPSKKAVHDPQPRKGIIVQTQPKEAEKPSSTAAAGPARVVLITVDGWHAKLTEHMPVWKEMAAAGSWTLDAEVPKGATTAISHAALYTGADPDVNGVTREPDKLVDKDPHVHGVKFRWTPLKVSDTIFTATEAAGYEAKAVVQKGKLVGMLRPNGDETGIRVYGDSGLLKAACADLRDDGVRLIVLHIGSPDGAGHNHGWLSEEQFRAAEQVSDQLVTLRKCIADAEAAGGVPTTLIVTSDHGGTPVDVCQARRHKDRCGHGANDADNRRVPWIAIGPGIKPGHRIASAIRLVDTAPTILRILGIPASSIPTLSGVSVDEIFIRP